MSAHRATPWIVSGVLLLACTRLAAEAPSVPGADAPELARLGPHRVGVMTAHLVDGEHGDRKLDVDLWYPTARAGKAETYRASLVSEPPKPPAEFTIAGIASRDAPVASGSFPLVIVSHGYGNVTVAMSWLTENLASKGYVVAAIRHDDPPITDPAKFPVTLLHRPRDIAFVAAQLQGALADRFHIDAQRVALVGYSMGGYGVLTAAGATLDPDGLPNKIVPEGALQPYVRGGRDQQRLRVKNLRAVVAMAPAGGGTLAAWGSSGLESLEAPLLLVAGDHDRTVDYTTGARAFFAAATHARRYLLTLKYCGHAIGLGPAPESMRSELWNRDWFEDPVWRASRITGVTQHFITAFLDRHLKGDESRAAYLDVPVTDGSATEWPNAQGTPYGAYSPGTAGITVWKGFQRKETVGLELLRAEAAPVN